ncbi:hypothetical protein H5410_002510 [Solanum commersonii]|uniref:Uncharacterized protein n=1 Tax=Solanum commersonii TaxID=4109 RepID=A0A9J6B248_SOLCO|nr:hypothetical protein H5410_002510 [Solanum commersonii]
MVRLLKINKEFSIYSHQKLVLADSLASADCSFHHLFDPLPSRLHILEQRAESVLLAICQVCSAEIKLQLLCSFQPFCSFLRLSVHAFAKTSNT